MNDIKKQKRWVVWNLEQVRTSPDEKKRTTKIPYAITGKKASSTDAATWTTYEKAKKASEFFSGIGVVFTPDETLLGIDLDHILDKNKVIGADAVRITKLIKEAATYTEISPSGNGLHLYLQIEEPLTLAANRHAPFEAYTSGRFFTFTEKSYGKELPIRTVSKEEALRLLAIIGYPWKKEQNVSASTQPSSTGFSDENLLTAMFRSKKGATLQALYEGDASAYENDISRADAALLNHLAFWSGKDAAQMERIWLNSPLGSREKTQKRQDYRSRSIEGAIANCKEVYKDPKQGIDFLYTMGGKDGSEKIITQNTENICRVLDQHPEFSGLLRFDTFTNIFEIKEKDLWRPFEDNDAVRIQTRISILFSFFRKVGKEMVYDAIVKVSKDNAVDSAIEHIKSIVWDETNRLDEWLTHTYGTPSDVYHRAVASNWIKGLVKRLIEPGCKFDYVLVLEGEQGVKKSTSLHVLGEVGNHSWHVETTMSTDSKDFFMQFSGKAIVEFSEGETLSRTEVKKMKAIITMQSDKYRPPYGRVSVDFPRRCVFAMTTNQDQYLKDETGNRRWLPVTVRLPEADIDWLRANRDQIFAEAYYRLTVKNESVYKFPREETVREQESRRISDPNEDLIVNWYWHKISASAREDGITIQQVHINAFNSGFGNGQMKKFEEMAIADVLRRVLLLTKKRKMIDGVQSWRWFNENGITLNALDSIMSETGDMLP